MAEAIAQFYERDGYDQIVTVQSILHLQYGNDPDALRQFVNSAIDRFGDSPNVMYQAHRALLWLGDIDEASNILPIIHTSYMPEDSQYLVSLRQACAENRVADADRLFLKHEDMIRGDASIAWLSHKVLGNEEQAVASLAEYDAKGDMLTMVSFLPYGIFDPRPFPKLMAILNGQGIDFGEPVELPYRCRR